MLRKLFILHILLITCGCASDGLVNGTTEADKDVKYQEKVVSGIPIWPGMRFGGLHKTVTAKKIRKDMNIAPPPPPEPKNLLKEVIGKVAVWIAVGGLVGLLLSAVAAYYRAAWWDDIAAVSGICFSGGSALAYKYELFMWVATFASVAFVAYLIYNAYKKHHADNTKHELIDTVDFVKTIDTWDDKAKQLLHDLQSKGTKKAVEASQKYRNKDRRKARKRSSAITQALNTWEQETT